MRDLIHKMYGQNSAGGSNFASYAQQGNTQSSGASRSGVKARQSQGCGSANNMQQQKKKPNYCWALIKDPVNLVQNVNLSIDVHTVMLWIMVFMLVLKQTRELQTRIRILVCCVVTLIVLENFTF